MATCSGLYRNASAAEQNESGKLLTRLYLTCVPAGNCTSVFSNLSGFFNFAISRVWLVCRQAAAWAWHAFVADTLTAFFNSPENKPCGLLQCQRMARKQTQNPT
jgi:hypothetical protein